MSGNNDGGNASADYNQDDGGMATENEKSNMKGKEKEKGGSTKLSEVSIKVLFEIKQIQFYILNFFMRPTRNINKHLLQMLNKSNTNRKTKNSLLFNGND